MRLDRIYTKTGDGGKTSLITGERVSKGSDRVEAFGTVDELNSIIGIIRTLASRSPDSEITADSENAHRRIQNDLFDAGAILAATPGLVDAYLPPFPAARCAFLETCIDRYQQTLDELPSFVVPGGTDLNAYAHLARTVCRRAERVLWRLHEKEPVQDSVLTYINRLSDYWFVYSRWVVKRAGGSEFLWKPGESDA